MSFSSEVKNEVSKMEILPLESVSELSAIVRNHAKIGEFIELNFENAAIAKRVYLLFKEIFNLSVTIVPLEKHGKKQSHIYQILIDRDVNIILDKLGLLEKSVPDYLISDDDEKRAYLRGIFLSSGSISDPKTSNYHLEFSLDGEKHAKAVLSVLEYFGLNAKYLRRDSGYMVYLKESEKISDFLKIIGSNLGVLYFEDIRIYRDHKNMTNRWNNCDQANINKAVNAANHSLKMIEIIEDNLEMDFVDDKIKEAILLRKKNPDATLQELSDLSLEVIGKHISKPGLFHRYKKIEKMAMDILG